MKKVLVFLIVIIVLVVGGGAAAYFLLGPEQLTKTLGLAPPTPTPIPSNLVPTLTPDPGFAVVVARFDIPGGTLISDTQMLETKNIPTKEYEARATNIFKGSQIGDIQGKLLNVSVRAGMVIEQSFLSVPGLSQQLPTAEKDRPRLKAYPVQVDTLTGVANQIHEGDTVDVVATFKFERRVYLPPEPAQPPVAAPGAAPQPTTPPVGSVDMKPVISTKTIVQRAKVLAIVRPPPPTPVPPPPDQQPAEPTTKGQPPAQPQAGVTSAPAPPKEEEKLVKQQITAGNWQVVLAVNDQQAELIEFSQQSGARVTLVLRGSGDNVYEQTIGASFDLLLSEFGLPLPQPENPFIFAPEVLTPQPTRTPSSKIRIP